MTKEMAINILRGDVLGTNEQTHEAVFMAVKALKEQARADAVEVVRCKDCIHRFKDGENVVFNCCELNHNKVQADEWFCADGERREDETG